MVGGLQMLADAWDAPPLVSSAKLWPPFPLAPAHFHVCRRPALVSVDLDQGLDHPVNTDGALLAQQTCYHEGGALAKEGSCTRCQQGCPAEGSCSAISRKWAAALSSTSGLAPAPVAFASCQPFL